MASHQPPLKDGRGHRVTREWGSSGSHPRVEEKIKAEAKKYGVTPGWVRATALAIFFGEEENHLRYDERRRKRNG